MENGHWFTPHAGWRLRAVALGFLLTAVLAVKVAEVPLVAGKKGDLERRALVETSK